MEDPHQHTSLPAVPDPSGAEASGLFPRTAWSRICAGSGGAGPEAVKEALEDVCRRYWRPAQRFLQSLGCSPHDAEDLTQQFLARWANPESLSRLEPAKGRLRSYLKQSLRRMFVDEWRHRQRMRRGGGEVPLSLDEDGPEISSGDEDQADWIYDASWAEAVVSVVTTRMRSAYAGRGRGELFDSLRGTLPGGMGVKPYAGIAVSSGMSEPRIKLEVHRLRRRFAEELRAEVAGTLANPDDVEDELRHLVRVMAHVHRDPA